MYCESLGNHCSNSWWCQTSRWNIFSKPSTSEFWKDILEPSLASSRVGNVYRTLWPHSNSALQELLLIFSDDLGKWALLFYFCRLRWALHVLMHNGPLFGSLGGERTSYIYTMPLPIATAARQPIFFCSYTIPIYSDSIGPFVKTVAKIKAQSELMSKILTMAMV